MKVCPLCTGSHINSYGDHIDWCRACKQYIPNTYHPYWNDQGNWKLQVIRIK